MTIMEQQSDCLHPPELVVLAQNISCNFIDARTTTKDYVKAAAVNNAKQCGNNEADNKFFVSTCLRYEIYDCCNDQKHIDPFFHVRGSACIRRLLSMLVGLQSEIIGEREILIQTVQSINKSRDAGNLDDNTFRGLQELISISEQIRTDCGINSDENYSTIAADLFFERLTTRSDVILAIVGGGYMAEKFFSALLKAMPLKIRKLLWINRSTIRIENNIRELVDLLDFDIEVLDLYAGKQALSEADAIFCALANSPCDYRNVIYKEGAFVVDVSYPQTFPDEEDVEIVTISNTYFSRLVKKPVPKTSITLANSKIDAVVASLASHI